MLNEPSETLTPPLRFLNMSLTFFSFLSFFLGGAGKTKSVYRWYQSQRDGAGGTEFILAFSFCACWILWATEQYFWVGCLLNCAVLNGNLAARVWWWFFFFLIKVWIELTVGIEREKAEGCWAGIEREKVEGCWQRENPVWRTPSPPLPNSIFRFWN